MSLPPQPAVQDVFHKGVGGGDGEEGGGGGGREDGVLVNTEAAP